jgi:predicted secreted hydrolase
MDHEFSSSFLEKGQQGWDWFSIQLDDGHELMIYQIRTSSGDADPHSSGTWVAPNGRLTVLRSEDFELIPGRTWTSDRSRGRYPIEWRLKVPSLELDLDVLATFPSQEMDTRESTGIIYWEGTMDVRGRHGGGETSGSGYLEMTGYADTPLGGLLDN